MPCSKILLMPCSKNIFSKNILEKVINNLVLEQAINKICVHACHPSWIFPFRGRFPLSVWVLWIKLENNLFSQFEFLELISYFKHYITINHPKSNRNIPLEFKGIDITSTKAGRWDCYSPKSSAIPQAICSTVYVDLSASLWKLLA